MGKVDNDLIILKKLHEKLVVNNFSTLMEEEDGKRTFCYEVHCGSIFYKVNKDYEQKWFNIDVVHDVKHPRMTKIVIGICTMKKFEDKSFKSLMNGSVTFSVLVANDFDNLDSLLIVGKKLLDAAIVVES